MARYWTNTVIVLMFVFAANLVAQEIPKTAVILEKTNVTPNRELILWMENATKNERDVHEIYACPEETRGHYYSGIAKVSLVDLRTKKTVNTLEIDRNSENSLDLPFLIHRGYYRVPKLDKNREGKPILMNLKDYNADGKPYEFAIFNALACMGLDTTLIGYSAKQDKVIQYEIDLKTHGKTSTSFWADYLFGHKPNKQGIWRYTIDYRGRAGSLDKYEIRYDRMREKFYGELHSLFVE